MAAHTEAAHTEPWGPDTGEVAVVRSVPARGHAGAGTGAGAVQCPRCTTHKLFVSEGVRQPEAFECFECSARGQGARWHCALCRSDLCDACYATRAARAARAARPAKKELFSISALCL